MRLPKFCYTTPSPEAETKTPDFHKPETPEPGKPPFLKSSSAPASAEGEPPAEGGGLSSKEDLKLDLDLTQPEVIIQIPETENNVDFRSSQFDRRQGKVSGTQSKVESDV